MGTGTVLEVTVHPRWKKNCDLAVETRSTGLSRSFRRSSEQHSGTMSRSRTPTVREWLRGWTLTYIPNEKEAEGLAQTLQAEMEDHGLQDLPLSDPVRQELEALLGTAQDEDARSPATVMEEVLLEHLPPEIAQAAGAPLAYHTLNQGERTLDVDVEEKMPPSLARMIEKVIRPHITEEALRRLQEMYEKFGPAGLRRWLVESN